MNQYRALNVVTVHSGILKLSKDQAKRRMHSLVAEKKGKGLFEITSPVQFKAGEEFGYKGELPKNLVADLEKTKKKKVTDLECEHDMPGDGSDVAGEYSNEDIGA